MNCANLEELFDQMKVSSAGYWDILQTTADSITYVNQHCQFWFESGHL